MLESAMAPNIGSNGQTADQKKDQKDQIKQSKRPKNNKFTQQKLDSWQPILTPQWVIGSFIAVAVVFIPVGASLIWSKNYFEVKVEYDGPDAPSECVISDNDEGYRSLNSTSPITCILNFTFPRDVESDDDLYLYYQLSEFYQNHRRYVQSRSDAQLRNDVGFASFSSLKSSLSSDCEPEGSLVVDSDEGDRSFLFYPCGLIARSYFNDGIQLYSFERNDQVIYKWENGIFLGDDNEPRLSIDTTNIAWESDLREKFRNPTNETNKQNELVGNALQYQTYEYLWQRYDQASCYNKSQPSQRLECLNWTARATQELGSSTYDQRVKGPINGAGCAKCRDEDGEDAVLVYEGGIPPPDDLSDSRSANGIRNENFVVWMRIAALPTFRKLYGTINSEGTVGIKEGDVLRIRIIPNFLVSSFDGTKSLIIGTASPLGSQNRVLGIAYFSVGIVCVTLAVLFFLKLKINPRKLGDPKYLHWKQN